MNLDHIKFLAALKEIPFTPGRKLLVDVVIGDSKNKSIIKNKLSELDCFASLIYDSPSANALLDRLISNKLVRQTSVHGKRFLKVLELTDKGDDELVSPSLSKKNEFKISDRHTVFSDKDRLLFDNFDFFLGKFNDHQKKAIVSDHNKILCIAGAGSGKTTVLTKRVEFLNKFKSVNLDKILAITFTRKARQEMQERLRLNGIVGVQVETFNSFSEKILKENEAVIYGRKMSVLSYSDKFKFLNSALHSLNIDPGRAVDIYFTKFQKRSKSQAQLLNIFMNDCFFVLDYFKSKNVDISSYQFVENTDSSKLVHDICLFLDDKMQKEGFRDYMDQVLDTISFFKSNKSLIPSFDHILVDEFQDVNSSQMDLINLLNGDNIFFVGDPRQSIFGWRGSDINFIVDLANDSSTELINLTINYRSSKFLVDLMNLSIRDLKLPDLEPFSNTVDGDISDEKNIFLQNFSTESEERDFILNSVKELLGLGVSEIFVLSRTNRQLNDMSELFNHCNLPHSVRSNDRVPLGAMPDKGVVLATVHSIKGLEADHVFVIGCNSLNFPVKGSEHPVVEMVKVDEYDKESEEQRLFYVAISRAKNYLYLSYTGSLSHFFTVDMLKSIHS